jgi:hypothetical protein
MVVGSVATWWFMRHHVATAASFVGHAEYSLWSALLAGLVGGSAALSVHFLAWLVELHRLDRSPREGPAILPTLWRWFSLCAPVVVGLAGVVLATKAVGRRADASPLDRHLANQTLPVTIVTGVLALPGLVGWLKVRSLARSRVSWPSDPQAQLRMIITLRGYGRRYLGSLGAVLTLIVVASGMRRHLLIEVGDVPNPPAESVLLYGLVYAVVLGLFYVLASMAIDQRGAELLDRCTPLPDLQSIADIKPALDARTALATVTGTGGGSWNAFQASVVVVAPLLSALLATATGK